MVIWLKQTPHLFFDISNQPEPFITKYIALASIYVICEAKPTYYKYR